MKDYDKEIENIFLDEEEDVLERIRIVYQNSLKDVQAYAKKLQKELDDLLETVDIDDEIGKTKIRSKVYQLEYQTKLAIQINNYLDLIKSKDVNNITDYINKVYSNGFLTEQYRLMRNGINITMPINQKLLKKAVTFKTEDIPLSTRLYDNVEKAKKEIINEISRGLSIGMSVPDMARNLQNTMGVSMRKAYQIAQNEGARVRQSAIIDSMREAKKKGADIVKQWSATLDGKTRPVHQELDGQWVEIEEDFEYSGGKVFAPKQFGIPSEDINCRCTLLSVPRWDLEDEHWQMDNESKELVKVKNYKDWYDNYYLPRETESYKSYSDFVMKIVENWEKLQRIPKDTPKEKVETILRSLGFDEKYKIGELNEKLQKIGGDKNVVLSRSNLSYIISRHASEFLDSGVLLNMQSVLYDYDVVAKGKKQTDGDFVFYKMFENDGYGIEMKMNKISGKSDEYIVHYLMVSNKHNRAIKLLNKYLKSDAYVDKKK